MTHGGVLIEGAVAGANYDKEGWFPIQDYSFEVKELSEEKDDKAGGHKMPAPTPAAKPGSKPAVKSSSERDGTTITMNKKVDRATTDLMWLAMSHRTKKGGKGAEDKVHCDIHVLSYMELKNPTNLEVVANVYPILMLHLEGVSVTDWSIGSSGEERGNEKVAFHFDRAAIRYLSTPDGWKLDPGLDTGWDQLRQEMWPNAQSDWHLDQFDKYTPRLF